MNKDEALRLALEALKTCQIDGDGWSGPHYYFDGKKVGKAIIAIRQALEQPEPEPVAWLNDCEEIHFDKEDAFRYSNGFIQPLYTSPPKREPLTDEEIDEVPFALFEPDQGGMSATEALREFARAIEAAHGIKGEA